MMPQSESHIKNGLDYIRCAKCSMPSTPMDLCEKGKYKHFARPVVMGWCPLTLSELSHIYSVSVKGKTFTVIMS